MTWRQKHLVVDVLPEAGITVADIQMLLFWMQSVFNVFVYHVFVCMYEYAAACLGQDTLVKEFFFNFLISISLFSWLNKC